MSHRHLGVRHHLSGYWIRKPWNQNRWQYWRFNTNVMVRVDAHFLLLRRERKIAKSFGLQFMVRLKVRPTPDSAVDDVGQAFPVRHLEHKYNENLDTKDREHPPLREVSLHGWSPVLQVWIQLLHYIQKHIFFVGQVQSC